MFEALELSTQSWSRKAWGWAWAWAARGAATSAREASARQKRIVIDCMPIFPASAGVMGSVAAAHRPAHQRELVGAAEGMRMAQDVLRPLHVGEALLAEARLVPLVAGGALLLPQRLVEAFDRREQRNARGGQVLDRAAIHRERAERDRLIETQSILGPHGRCSRHGGRAGAGRR